jgi:hypothetical protein
MDKECHDVATLTQVENQYHRLFTKRTMMTANSKINKQVPHQSQLALQFN